MKVFTTVVAIIGMAGVALSQGVTSAIAPSASSPAGCSASYDGNFEVTVAKVAAQKRTEPIAKRASCSGTGTLVASLANGVLTDAQSRTGYIASNFQFQFDKPPQAGAIFTSGFSSCGNGSLALGGSAVFYECESGDFFNLYDRNWAAQCSPVEVIILPCGGTASEADDGQVVGTQVITTTVVSALSDGQPQVKTTTTGVPICQVSQISDGQVQVGTTPCASITSAPANTETSTLAPVSQYSDGQIQVTPASSLPTVTSAAATSAAAGTSPSGAAQTTGSTLATSKASGASSGASSALSSGTSSGASSATSAPASSGAGSVRTGSMAALMVGLIGAAAFL